MCRNCRKIFLEALFFFKNSFNKVFRQNFVITYHWLGKFTIVLQPIIIQNYNI